MQNVMDASRATGAVTVVVKGVTVSALPLAMSETNGYTDRQTASQTARHQDRQ